MKHIFIINPTAGDGKCQRDILYSIDSKLKNIGIDFEVYVTKSKNDIEDFIHKICLDTKEKVFYACGGDGTLHDVVNSVYGYENVCVGLIPCGSGNDFVKNFNNPMFFTDILAQIEGEATCIDLIKANEKLCISVCNVGFDADAAFNVHKFKIVPFVSGSTRYLLSVFNSLLHKLGKELRIGMDDEFIEDEFLLGVIANGHSYGGGYKCAPLAKINDGLLDVCLVKKISRIKILNFISSYKKGQHLENESLSKYINYKKCTSVKIYSNEMIKLCIDGENYEYKDLIFSIKVNAVKFWVPKGASII